MVLPFWSQIRRLEMSDDILIHFHFFLLAYTVYYEFIWIAGKT